MNKQRRSRLDALITKLAECAAEIDEIAQEEWHMPKLKLETEWVYARSMGKALRVTAWFATDAEANSFMERNPDAAVVAVIGGLVLLANKHDKGVPIPRG